MSWHSQETHEVTIPLTSGGDRDSGYGRSNRYGNKDYYYGNKYQNGNGYQSYNRSNGYGQGNSVTGHFNSRDQQTFLQKSFYSAWNPEQMKQYATELMFNMTANMQGYQNGGYNYNGSTAAENGDAHQGEARTGARLDPEAPP